MRVAFRAFVAREGHALVPGTSHEGDVPLGLWVQQRRHEHRTGRRRIAPALTTLLEALPYWAWDLDGQPTHRFDALLAFARQHGHVDIPYRGREANWGLGWVGRPNADPARAGSPVRRCGGPPRADPRLALEGRCPAASAGQGG